MLIETAVFGMFTTSRDAQPRMMKMRFASKAFRAFDCHHFDLAN
jgi:hypothetical protein